MAVIGLAWWDSISAISHFHGRVHAGSTGALPLNIPQLMTILQPYLLALRGPFGYIFENLDGYTMGAG
jgi:hypothetical protein